MLQRKVLTDLGDWRLKSNRKPLILRGARQVGKTTAVNIFAEEFKQYIYLNLDLASDKKIFDDNEDFNKIFEAIYFLKNANPDIEDTLIFIDEIQNSPKAVSLLRYFYENKKNSYVIAAGSLLESLIDKNISFPVGRIEYRLLYPFCFEEFLLAMGEKNAIKAYNTIPLPSYAHEKLEKLFRTYLLIGGMPEVVNTYAEQRDLVSIKPVINNLVTSYKDDVEKYSKSKAEVNILRHVIDNSFYYAGERIKFNGFGNSNYRSREIGEAFRTLEKTMLLKLIYPATNHNFPIMPDRKKSPRLQLLDTGLVNFISGIEKDIYESRNITDIYRGRIAEHIAGQEFMSLEKMPGSELYFWVRDKKQSSAEVDFIFPHKNKVYPVEIKSGASGKLRSLHQFIETSNIKLAVRYYMGPLSLDNIKTPSGTKCKLLSLPISLTGKIREYIEWAANS